MNITKIIEQGRYQSDRYILEYPFHSYMLSIRIIDKKIKPGNRVCDIKGWRWRASAIYVGSEEPLIIIGCEPDSIEQWRRFYERTGDKYNIPKKEQGQILELAEMLYGVGFDNIQRLKHLPQQ